MKMISLGAVLLLAASAIAQDVTVTAVVKDKNKPSLDLGVKDFKVTTDGQEQKITAVRAIDGADVVSGGARTPADPALKARLVTLVFEKIEEYPRRIARQAALEFAKNAPPEYLISVVQVDKQLTLVQPFTNDKAALKNAVERATDGRYQVYQQASNEMRQKMKNGAVIVTGADPGIAKQLTETQLNMMAFDEGVEDSEGTRRTLFSLLSLTRGQWSFPGRKAIFHFSQGLYVWPNMEEAFRALTAAANRGGVSIYSLECSGVEGVSASGANFELLQSREAGVQSDNGLVTRDQAVAAERGENAGRANNFVRLEELAKATGGALYAGTNDLRGGIKKASEDLSTYYLVSFTPAKLDGKIHKLEIEPTRGKIAGPRDFVAASIESAVAPIVLPFEAALEEQLAAKPMPSKVAYHAGLFHLQPAKDGVKSLLIVEVPMSNLTFTENAATKAYRARTSVLALIKDASGKVVKRFARDLPLTGPSDKIAMVKAGNFIYRENLTLAPGKYTLETAASDGEGNQFGARTQTVEVAATAGVGLSNLFLVRNYQQGVKDLTKEEPLQFNGGRVTPSMTGRIINSPGTTLAVFFTVYPDGSSAKPELTIEYLAGGQVLAAAPLQLPAPDSLGRIPYVMSSPADSLPAGDYEIRATVKQGASSAKESVFVKVEAPKL